jgi:uncharacterized protein involved in cysteine biosynthesis
MAIPVEPRRCPACGYPAAAEPCPRCEGSIRREGHGKLLTPGPRNPISDLVQGFSALPLGALALFTRKEYFGRLAVAMVANLVVLSVLLGGMWYGLWSLTDWALGADWGGLDWLRVTTEWLAGLLSIAVAAILVWLLAPVLIETILSPFLDPLADATERTWIAPDNKSLDQGLWHGIVYSVRIAAQILLIQLALLIPVFLISLTGIGAIAAALVTAWLNALVWLDVPCSRRGYDLRDRFELIKRNWARSIGFGLAFQLGLFVPVFNILLLTPAAAVGISTLYLHFDKTGVLGRIPAGTISAPPRPPSGRP